jgi:hypothetical protein
VRFGLLEITVTRSRAGMIVEADGDHEWGLVDVLAALRPLARVVVRGEAKHASSGSLARALARLPNSVEVVLEGGWIAATKPSSARRGGATPARQPQR